MNGIKTSVAVGGTCLILLTVLIYGTLYGAKLDKESSLREQAINSLQRELDKALERHEKVVSYWEVDSRNWKAELMVLQKQVEELKNACGQGQVASTKP